MAAGAIKAARGGWLGMAGGLQGASKGLSGEEEGVRGGGGSATGNAEPTACRRGEPNSRRCCSRPRHPDVMNPRDCMTRNLAILTRIAKCNDAKCML